jgi:hypothetical protein
MNNISDHRLHFIRDKIDRTVIEGVMWGAEPEEGP